VIVLAAIVVAEQGVEHTVKPMLEGFTPMPFLIVSGLFALGLKGAFRKWEKRLEAVALYREEFRKRLRNGWDISEVETLFLDRLQDALQISSRDVRSIESGILIEQEEELRARLEMFQRNAIDERGPEEWQSTKSIWLSSIRDLSTQLTTFSTVHSTPGALVH
jgi:hypothetical protein